jgi:antitoxin VapB
VALSIKNEKLENSAKELARLKGVTITQALLDCTLKEIRREKELRLAAPQDNLWARVQQMQKEYEALREIGPRLTDDEVLGFDHMGIPRQ